MIKITTLIIYFATTPIQISTVYYQFDYVPTNDTIYPKMARLAYYKLFKVWVLT